MTLRACPKPYWDCQDFAFIAQPKNSISLPYSAAVGLMRGAIAGLFALAATATDAEAGNLAKHSLHRPFVLTMRDNAASPARGDAAPLLGHFEPHYRPQASGLDRIDPSAMQVWGGQIGGEGVKGGAVVSLTWPTE